MNAATLRALLLFSLTAPVSAAPVWAAAPQDGAARVTVKARFEPATAGPGDTVTLVIDGEIEPNYHLYGSLDQGGTVPKFTAGKTALAALQAKGSFEVPEGKMHVHPDLPDHPNFWIEGKVRFKQAFVVKKDAAPGALAFTGDLVYMACTPEFCDPPFTEKIAASLTITGAKAGSGGGAEPEGKTPEPVAGGAAANVAATGAQAKGSQEKGSQDKPAALASTHTGKKQVMEIKLVPSSARAGEVVTVEVHTKMEPGWHNYGSAQDPETGAPVTLKLLNQDLEPVGKPEIPRGKAKVVEFVGTYHVLVDDWVMRQKARIPADAKPGEIEVAVETRYTACDENYCLDPVTAKLGAKLVVEAGAARQQSDPGGAATAAKGDKAAKSDGAAKGSDAAATGSASGAGAAQGGSEFQGGDKANELSLWLYLIGAVGAGLFALVMPCTYPMIPLTVSFFTKQAEAKGSQPVALALAYGGGIIGCYVVLGGLLGPLMQQIATNGTVNLIFGLAFVFFALTLFGLVELRPPAFLMRSAAGAQSIAAGSSSSAGALLGVFLMGATLCITSFACTAPFLGSMLAAGAGDKTRLLLGMTVFGLTMALPFVALSLVPGRLPSGGAWMNSAKILFGFVELAAAVKFLSNWEFAWNLLILPREVFLAIWTMLFLIAGVYLLGMIKLKGETGEIGGGRLITGTAVLSLAAYFAIGASGVRFDNMVMTAFEPPYSSASQAGLADTAKAGQQSHTIVEDDFDRAVQVASTAQKLLLVNFTGKL